MVTSRSMPPQRRLRKQSSKGIEAANPKDIHYLKNDYDRQKHFKNFYVKWLVIVNHFNLGLQHVAAQDGHPDVRLVTPWVRPNRDAVKREVFDRPQSVLVLGVAQPVFHQVEPLLAPHAVRALPIQFEQVAAHAVLRVKDFRVPDLKMCVQLSLMKSRDCTKGSVGMPCPCSSRR